MMVIHLQKSRSRVQLKSKRNSNDITAPKYDTIQKKVEVQFKKQKKEEIQPFSYMAHQQHA